MSKPMIKAALAFALVLGFVGQAFGQAQPSAKERESKLIAVLKSNVTRKEKADACRELAIIGSKEAVAPLAALLADAELSHMARFGLEPIPDPAVDDALRDALGKVTGRPLVGVIGSVGVRRDVKAIEPLAKLLRNENADVAQAAARALGKIGTVEAAKAIQGAIGSTPAGNQLAFCEGLFRCAEAMAAKGQRAEAIAIYDQLRNTPAHHQVRTAALRGAILARQTEGLALLKQYLRSEDYLLFAAAMRTTHEMAGSEVTQAMAAELAQLPADNQVLMILTLGKRGDAAALPALFAAAKGDVKSVRLAAIRSLPQIGDPAAVAVLVSMISDADREVAQQARESLASLPGKEADAAIVALLESSATDQKVLGMELVGRRRMTSCTPVLLKAAEGTDAVVRMAAIRRLGELASVAELPAVLDLLMQAKGQDLDATEQALSSICSRADNPEACVEKLTGRYPQAQAAQKIAVLRVLSGIGGTESLKAVRVALNDSSTEDRVHATAIRLLGTWKTADAAPDLLALAKTASKPADKVLGLRGYLGMAARSDLSVEQRLAMCREAAGLVQRDEEKRLLLGALSNLNTPEAIGLIMPYLDDAGIKEEASTACITIADRMLRPQNAPKPAAVVIEALEKTAKVTTNEEMSRRAKTLLEQAKNKK